MDVGRGASVLTEEDFGGVGFSWRLFSARRRFTLFSLTDHSGFCARRLADEKDDQSRGEVGDAASSSADSVVSQRQRRAAEIGET